MKNERRRKRSELVQEAVALYFEAVIERSRIKAMALANEDGLLVAGAGPGYDHEWLAALGVAEQGEHLEEIIDEVTHGEGFVAYDIPIHGRTLRLSAVGQRGFPLEDASLTLARIFAPFFGARAPIVAAG